MMALLDDIWVKRRTLQSQRMGSGKVFVACNARNWLFEQYFHTDKLNDITLGKTFASNQLI